MALTSIYEDIVERRAANEALAVFDYQMNFKPSVAAPESPPAPAGLSAREKMKVKNFLFKLLMNTEYVHGSLLSEADDWMEAHFEELNKRSPHALIRLLMAYRVSKRQLQFLLEVSLEADNPTKEAITMPEPKKKNKLNIKIIR
jgi:hypothetical protein